VIAYELMTESGVQLFRHGESNYQIIFAFCWLEDLQTIYVRFFILELWFCHCCIVTWKLVLDVC